MVGYTPDADVKRAYDWFVSQLEVEEWMQRKKEIEAYVNSVLEPKMWRPELKLSNALSVQEDRMGWYLYLVDALINEPLKYEPTQGARVVPLFKRMGEDLSQLEQILGINGRVRRILRSEKKQPDAGLFELLTALLWVRNGWKRVEFIPETGKHPTPDFVAASDKEEWYVECKRLEKSSQYSQKEREKWLIMWQYLRNFIVEKRLPIVLDIVIHVELESLPDDFLLQELSGKLPFVFVPCPLVSNKTLDVQVSFVNFARIKAHLEKNYVKLPSDQLNLLIAGRRDSNRGFTSMVAGKIVHGPGGGNNQYVSDLDFAAGCFWSCDADRANERKARDIRKHLSSALQQLPHQKNCVVHIGLETLDGWDVESERYARIVSTVANFDTKGKNLAWVYCHLFQAYSPPDEVWVIDETVYRFPNRRYTHLKEPLKHHFIVGPHDMEAISGVHWQTPQP